MVSKLDQIWYRWKWVSRLVNYVKNYLSLGFGKPNTSQILVFLSDHCNHTLSIWGTVMGPMLTIDHSVHYTSYLVLGGIIGPMLTINHAVHYTPYQWYHVVLGAAIGPLLTGVISTTGWKNVFYMLIGADIMALLVSSYIYLAYDRHRRTQQSTAGDSSCRISLKPNRFRLTILHWLSLSLILLIIVFLVVILPNSYPDYKMWWHWTPQPLLLKTFSANFSLTTESWKD